MTLCSVRIDHACDSLCPLDAQGHGGVAEGSRRSLDLNRPSNLWSHRLSPIAFLAAA